MVITMKKRLISFILTVVMLFAIVPTAFAASDKAVAAANALHELGLFNGTGTDANGNPVYDLDRVPSRHEAVTMLVRLLGKETEAQNGTWNTPFSDVAEWAKPYVGYAYTNGLTAGTSATTFGGNGTVTAAQYITFVLRALGYESGVDFQWDKSWELSDSIGLTNGEYNANTSKFTRGDVAIISNNALSVPCKDGTALTPSNSSLDALGKELQGYWLGKNYSDDAEYTECFLFNGTKYSCAYRCVNNQGICIYTGYEEGTFTTKEKSIVLNRTSGQDYVESTKQLKNTEASETTYSVKTYYGETLFLNNWIYQRMNEAEQTYNTYKNYVQSAQNMGAGSTSVNSADYAYLAGTDFRSIRRDYSTATAQCAYVYAYSNIDGDLCVMTYVQYKIISNYNQFTLHNMTTGSTIRNPDSYYQKLADRSAGMTRIHYMDLSSEVLKYQVKMLEATRSCLSGGANTWNGVYVTAAELNQ